MTRCQLLLSLLEDAGERGITTSEILEAGVGSRYGARLMELRKAGHSITSERVREGSWKYVLLDVEVGGDGVNKEPTYDSPHVTADLSAGEPTYGEPSDADPPDYYENADRAEALKLFESAA